MIILAKYPSTCSCCRAPISVGAKIERSKGSPAKHVACAQGSASTISARPVARRAWDASMHDRASYPQCEPRATTTHTVLVLAKPYEDYDDGLAAAIADVASDLGVETWQCEARWHDEERMAIDVEVRS